MQSNALDIAFDQNNFCWVSFANGIQKFDGKNFSDVPVQAGLPDDKWVKFFQSLDGTLFIGHSKGISKYEIGSNSFHQFYNNYPEEKSPPLFIGEDDHIVYFYTQRGNVTGIDLRTLKVVSEMKTGLPPYFSGLGYPPQTEQQYDQSQGGISCKLHYLPVGPSK